MVGNTTPIDHIAPHNQMGPPIAILTLELTGPSMPLPNHQKGLIDPCQYLSVKIDRLANSRTV